MIKMMLRLCPLQQKTDSYFKVSLLRKNAQCSCCNGARIINNTLLHLLISFSFFSFLQSTYERRMVGLIPFYYGARHSRVWHSHVEIQILHFLWPQPQTWRRQDQHDLWASQMANPQWTTGLHRRRNASLRCIASKSSSSSNPCVVPRKMLL